MIHNVNWGLETYYYIETKVKNKLVRLMLECDLKCACDVQENVCMARKKNINIKELLNQMVE